MKVLPTAVFDDPGIHAHFPAIRHTLDLEELEEWPTGRLGPVFVDGLPGSRPGLQEHGVLLLIHAERDRVLEHLRQRQGGDTSEAGA